MRLASFVPVFLAALTACQEPDSRIGAVTVQWMDWPTDVPAARPFTVRMIVSQPCAASGFREGTTADQSAVTYAPYFREVNEDVLCVARINPSVQLVGAALDTVVRGPGLAAAFSRTYEMRGATSVAAPAGSVSLPVRTFGEVRAIGAGLYVFDPARRNAGGFAAVETDTLGCVRIRPQGTFQSDDAVPLDEQVVPATATGFMRGRYYEPDEPVCGETRVFHLVSVN